MKKTQIIIVEQKKKRKSFFKTILTIAGIILAVAAAWAVVYKYLEEKYRSQILGRIDLDGDGEADAIMLDTTGNGELDTIIIDTIPEEEDTEI